MCFVYFSSVFHKEGSEDDSLRLQPRNLPRDNLDQLPQDVVHAMQVEKAKKLAELKQNGFKHDIKKVSILCGKLVWLLTTSFFFSRSTFVGSAWSFGLFIPATTANDLRLWRISIPDVIHYVYFPILILEKEPVFPFLMFSSKQKHYWYHIYNVFGMMRSLTGDWTRDLPYSKPALYH